MNNENRFGTPAENTQLENGAATGYPQTAFEYLKSLPPNFDRPAVESYRRERASDIIDYEVAETFTDSFRGVAEPFFIPLSWTLTKSALVKLLGITSHDGYEEVNGIRFYAGINSDKQLTLVAVSTKAGLGCNDDLTIADSYPYYDYADPCPSNCSNSGNLRIHGGLATPLKVIVTE